MAAGRGAALPRLRRGRPARLRLLPGDRVRAVAERRIEDVSQLSRVLRTARPPWRLEIERDGRALAVVIG